jgi:DNA-binding transcriptional LysR family regulator
MDRFDAMQVFVRVVEAGSLSAAARSIPMSLTSVSRHVSSLEQQFGTRLLRRTTRYTALTDDGRLFYERAKAILADLDEVSAVINESRGEPARRLRMAAPSLLGRTLIAPLLPRFLALHPGVSVETILTDRAVNLAEEDVHVAIRVGRLPDSTLIARKLGEVSMVTCAAPSYIERRGAPNSPNELRAHDRRLIHRRRSVFGLRIHRHVLDDRLRRRRRRIGLLHGHRLLVHRRRRPIRGRRIVTGIRLIRGRHGVLPRGRQTIVRLLLQRALGNRRRQNRGDARVVAVGHVRRQWRRRRVSFRLQLIAQRRVGVGIFLRARVVAVVIRVAQVLLARVIFFVGGHLLFAWVKRCVGVAAVVIRESRPIRLRDARMERRREDHGERRGRTELDSDSHGHDLAAR